MKNKYIVEVQKGNETLEIMVEADSKTSAWGTVERIVDGSYFESHKRAVSERDFITLRQASMTTHKVAKGARRA